MVSEEFVIRLVILFLALAIVQKLDQDHLTKMMLGLIDAIKDYLSKIFRR